jgi:hypothetical protein
MTRTILFICLMSIYYMDSFSQTLYLPSGTPQIGTSSNSNVGIGISNPESKLDVHVGTTSTVTAGLSVYRNGNPHLGIRLLTGVGDGASYTTWNGGLGSWYGIGFHSTQDGVTRGVFNVRDGSFSLRGSIYSGGNVEVGPNPSGGVSLISGPAYSGAIQIKTHVGAGGYQNRYLRLGVKDNTGAFYPVLSINDNQFVGIGTINPDAKLAVKGTIHAEEVKVDLNVPVPDYVFEKNYELRTLIEVENYINQNKHLPEVPAAKEMEASGVKLGEMNMLLLKKVEELTLYAIEQQKEINEQKKNIQDLLQKVKTLEQGK